jgi:hypothetical protein
MSWPNWTDMQLYQWLALGGGALALLALVLALALRKRGPVQVPAALGAALAAFAAGVGAGVVLLASFGYHWERRESAGREGEAAGPAPGNPMMAQVSVRGGGGAPGGRGGRGRGGPGAAPAPSPKAQLATLVGKLDMLTSKPLAVDLDAAKKKQVLEQLRGLGEKDELKDEEAKAKLDALLKVLDGDRDTLEAVGYRWPGAAAPGGGRGRGGAAQAPPNPFKEGDNGKHLKALQERLEKGAAG